MVYCHLSISCIFLIFFFFFVESVPLSFILSLFLLFPCDHGLHLPIYIFFKFMLLSYKYAHNQRNMQYMRGFVKCSCSYRWNFNPHQQTYIPRQKLFIDFMTIRLLSSEFLWHQNDCNMLTFTYNRPKLNSFFFKQKCNPRRQKMSKRQRLNSKR